MMNMARLLVVDDSPTIRKLVEISFRGSEWVVDYAASGAEGVSGGGVTRSKSHV